VSDRLPIGSERGGEVRRVLAIGSGFGIGVAIQANSIGWGIVASMTIFIIAQMFWYVEEWLRP
jgi:hypothetical protein